MSKLVAGYAKQTMILAVIIFTAVIFVWQGMNIYNTFFKVTAEVTVPDIVGKNYNEAKITLKRKGLRLMVIESRFSSDVPANVILEQNPNPDRTVKKGREVFVIVSSGPDTRKVPRLIGLSLRESKVMLKNYKLELGEVKRESVPEVEPEHVFKQSPEPGTVVEKGTKINLFVNSGAEPKILIPNLVGKDIKEARTELEKLGLEAGKITWGVKDETYHGDILQQSIEPGQFVYPKTSISFNVSIGSTSYEIWNIKQEIITFTVPSSNKIQDVKVAVNDDTGSSIIYEGKNAGGEELKLCVYGFGYVEYVIYINDQVEKRAQF